LGRGICFQVTDDTERNDVLRIIGPGTALFEAGNLPGRQLAFREPPAKQPGVLKMVFVGRFHPIKNLELLLQALEGITEQVSLTVIATPEDQVYEEKCRDLAGKLPGNIRVDFLLNVPHEKIEAHILSNHIFALPTRGENFGHAIFEALAAGRPVLVSDQTPWRGLEASKAGWDLPIDDPVSWQSVLRKVAGWDGQQLDSWCRGAWQKAAGYLEGHALKQEYLKQFN
jgi:glycosyltransferase involved in cell wall biosynthesis